MSTLGPAWRSVKGRRSAGKSGLLKNTRTPAFFPAAKRQPSACGPQAGPDYGNEIDLRQIQSFWLYGDMGRGVLKCSSDHTAIKVVQTGSSQSEKRNTLHAQQLGDCTQCLGHSVADTEWSPLRPAIVSEIK